LTGGNQIRAASAAGAPPELYRHKLFAPRRHAGAITRAAILGRIFADDSARVVLLQGPAGHGKSTTLQQLKSECEARGCLTTWLSLDEADNDPWRGFTHIRATVANLLGAATAAGIDAEVDVQPGPRQQSDWTVDQLRRLGQPAALFFDEFQTLREPALLRYFRGLLERVPDNVRIFIGSRNIPDIGMSRLLVNNEAIILRADELRFSRPEAEQFFTEAAGLSISGDEIQAIYDRTDGWPAALQLYRLALASPQVRRSLTDLENYRPRELAEYLIENVLELQPPSVQAFLLRTSLLHRLSAPLCDAVMGHGGSRDMLLDLERLGLFLGSLDQDRSWFKYHGLLAFFLGEQFAARSPALVREMHARAAMWFRGAGQFEEAVHHFLACEDFPAAADTMDQWTGLLVASGQLRTVERWSDRLPAAEIAGRPSLAIKIAYALMFLRRFDKLAPLQARLRTLAGGGDFCATTNPDLALAMAAICADDVQAARANIANVRLRGRQPTGFAAFEFGAAANLAAYCRVAASELEQARDLLAMARVYSDKADSNFSWGYNCGLSGISLLIQGHLPAALELFRSGLTRERMQMDGSLAAAAMVACNIWALYEANDLDAVEALFSQYHDGIAEAVLLDFLAVAYLPMVRTHDARQRPAAAAALLDEVERIGHATGWDRLARMAQWERVRRLLVSGAVERGAALAAGIPPSTGWDNDGWKVFSEDAFGDAIGQIRVAIHAGDLDLAARMLTAAMPRQRDRVTLRIKLHLLDAMLQQRRNNRAAAHRALRRALELAQPGRMIRTFIDEGDLIVGMLREEYRNAAVVRGAVSEPFAADRAFLEQLLLAASCEGGHAPAAAAPPLAELTDREREILTFLASGVLNREMAERLYVSENTVKFHLKNIYSKLDVANRLQAVTAARQLGIIQV
jgi:LuxR family maltose regulon positive regulatory protein